jgi:hypothetical protein
LALQRLLTGLGGNYLVSLECRPSAYLAQLAMQFRLHRLHRELQGAKRIYGHSIRGLVRHRILAAFWPSAPFVRATPAMLRLLNPDFARCAQRADRMSAPRLWRGDDFNVRRSLARILVEVMPQSVGCASAVIVPGATGDGYTPFFNRRLNEFCLSVPVEQQIRDGWDRLLLRRTMKGLLPDEVAWRKTRGFPVPALWARTSALQRKLPEAFAEMEKSSLVRNYLDLPRLREAFLAPGDRTLPTQNPSMVRDLFSLGWFLRWLDRTGGRT